jgi:hypothetical protein
MDEQPISDEKPISESLKGCNRLAIFAWGAIVAPVAFGLALGAAVVSGGEVLFGWFNFPPAANVELAILFVLALIVVLLAGILYVLSARR